VGDAPPLTCGGCALLCDDVALERDGEEVRLDPRCDLGARWFADRLSAHRSGAPAATIDGDPVELDAAVARATELLRHARRPMIHGFGDATIEDARAAVTLADRLGALVVTDLMAPGWPGAPAVPLRGASSATLGEIRDRAQIIVVWREDPMTTHPRLLQRLRAGDGDRALVVVDDRDTATARAADHRLSWTATHDLQALSYLQVAQRGRPAVSELSGDLDNLLDRVQGAVHAAIVYGPGLTAGPGGQRHALALHELVRALSHDRHVVTLALPPTAGLRSAQDVLMWQTGYGPNVDLAPGHPELLIATRPPDEGVDVALAIEGPPIDGASRTIALGCLPAAEAAVSIRTAAAGVGARATAHRLDGVPLALQAPEADDAPSPAQVLSRLTAAVTS
jgi:formylmethanofuran dehydrogenase subunit B